ncbi:DUF4274 domain-containing protein [Deinococcus altitudinis]|uniref:DUF4274 domain-containing protein n=1 Tax=Deinococcus altitudinis TaxID=468914 RepID=UPI003891A637
MKTSARLMTEFLPTAPDEAWLWFACDSNYDGNVQLIRWMIEQPRCPEAATLAIFWYSGAGYYGQYKRREDVPSFELDTYDRLQKIQGLYLSGFYKKSAVGFNPKNDPTPIGSLTAPGLDWTTEYEGGVHVPQEMKSAVPGSLHGAMNMPEGWAEGMPPEIAEIVFDEDFEEDEKD